MTATVYTSTSCGQCKQVKKLLKMKGVDYEEINIDTSPERHKEVMELSGQLRVPVTRINDNVIVGYNVGQIFSSLV